MKKVRIQTPHHNFSKKALIRGYLAMSLVDILSVYKLKRSYSNILFAVTNNSCPCYRGKLMSLAQDMKQLLCSWTEFQWWMNPPTIEKDHRIFKRRCNIHI